MFHPNRQVGGLPGQLLALMTILCLGMPFARLGGAEALRVPFALVAADAEVTLENFSEQSGAQIVYLLEEVRGVTTNPVQGEFAIRDALDRLVAGTALRVEQDGKTGAYAIRLDRKLRATAQKPGHTNTPASQTMKKSLPARFATVLAAFGSAILSAQTATPATPPKEEVVELSPFVVTADEDNGYQAANTLAGSRMNTSLKDTAASISVLTSEFLSDIGAVNLDEAIAFGNNVELDDTQTSNDNTTFNSYSMFRVRGQKATVARNYFPWRLQTNTFNVERIEEARGPNSILFGIASAGGLISSQTKQASTNRARRSANLVYGSYDERRASMDVNQAAGNGRFGVRFNAVVSKGQGYRHFVSSEDNRGHVALKWNVARNTVVRVEYEKGRTRQTLADNQEINDSAMKWFNAGRPVLLVTAADSTKGIGRNNTAANLAVNMIEESPGVFTNFDARGMGVTQGAASLVQDPSLVDMVNYTVNKGGPDQYRIADFDTWSAFIEQKVGRHTYLQVGYNHQQEDFSSWQGARAGNPLKGDPNKFLRDGTTPNPHAGQLYFDQWWMHYTRVRETDNFRFSASTEFDFGKWGEYRLAGQAERVEDSALELSASEVWFDEATNRGAFNALAGASVNRVFRRHYITPGAYETYHGGFTNPVTSGLFKGVIDPSNPARTIGSRMVPGISNFDDPQEQDSYLFSGQAYYLRRKLVLAGGLRYDTLYLHEGVRGLQDPVTGMYYIDNVNNPRNNRTLDAKTRTFGAVYHVLPWLSLRYNNSNSNELADTGVRLMPNPDANGLYRGSRVGDNPEGRGEDYGIDLNLFDGKFFVRATRFETSRTGAQSSFLYGGTVDNPATMNNRILTGLVQSKLITQEEADARTISTGGCTVDTVSKGYELSLIANPTRNWRVQLNYSVTDSVSGNVAPEIQIWAATNIPYYQQFDQNILLSTGDTIAKEIARWQLANQNNLSVVGVAEIGNRREKVSLVTRYSFTEGALKGFHMGGTVRHQSKNVVGATTAGESVYGNSFTRSDAFLGYRFGRVPGLKFLKDVSLQLNVYNVLDRHDPLISRFANVNAAVLDISRLMPQEPRFWRLTANFAF